MSDKMTTQTSVLAPMPTTMPAPIKRLGWLHFLNDFTLDFVSPLLPSQISLTALGFMEGIADGLAQVLKVWTGRASDRSGQRAPWLRAGYGCNAVARPLIAIGVVFSWPMWVVGCRILDRFGKGLRGSSADALVADWSEPAQRQGAYAHMRVMDHAGAVLGALTAAAVAVWALDYIAYAIAALAVPAALTMWIAYQVPDRNPQGKPPVQLPPLNAETREMLWGLSLAALCRLSPLLILASLVNQDTLTLWLVCLMWAGLAFAQGLWAMVAGWMATRWGSRRTARWLWMGTAMVLICLSMSSGPLHLALALLAISLLGCSEAAEKDLLVSVCGKERRATALGWLAMVAAGAALVGNVWCGYCLQYAPMFAFSLPIIGLVLAALWSMKRAA